MSEDQIATLDSQLNAMLREGKHLDAFEKFYAENIVMMENDQPFEGKQANRKREQEFFGGIQELHSASVGESAVVGNQSFCEQSFDATFKDGNRIQMEEVAVRTWENGQVIKERFYYKGQG